ncbi:MAG: hypothetical protein K6A15_05985 [Treponema sp.]|nr:hypothetical protein [Treponema sp.]
MQKVVLGFFFSYVDHENKQDLIKFITRDDEGRKQGLAEGLAEGALQKAIEAAIVLINDFNATPELAAKKMNAPLDKVLEALK